MKLVNIHITSPNYSVCVCVCVCVVRTLRRYSLGQLQVHTLRASAVVAMLRISPPDPILPA